MHLCYDAAMETRKGGADVRGIASAADLTAGEDPHSGIVASITNGSPCLVTCVDDERLEFQVGAVGGRLDACGVI
jgi:hypothetical protein